uniref:BBP1_C domain-containing protein n=1 Tax=Strongyloides venezuelensis TaxID=75913 RepID=A0A0K0G329_STRVS
MFEKIKKFWSSNSNISGSRKSSPRFVRTKSGRSISTFTFKKTTRPSYSNEGDYARPPRNLLNVTVAPRDGIYEEFHGPQSQEVIRRPSVPSTEDDGTLTMMNQDTVVQVPSGGYSDNNTSFCGFPGRESPSIRSTDHWLGSAKDEYLRHFRDPERPSLNVDPSSTLNYRSHMMLNTRRTRSFAHLPGSSKQSLASSNVGQGVNQVYDNQTDIYRERGAVRRQEPSLSSSGFVSNISSPLCRDRYRNVDNESPYRVIETRYPRYSNSSELVSPPRNPRVSVGSVYTPVPCSTPIKGTPNIYGSARNGQEDVFFDKSSRNGVSTAVSCQRIDEIEESLRDIQRKMSTTTSIQTPSNVQTDGTQQALLSILMDKKNEADRLREKIKRLENRIQKQKCDFAEETEKLQLEAENTRHKLKLMTEKFNRLDQEYRRYREATLVTENDFQKSLDDMDKIKKDYETEISCLKQKLTSVLVLEDNKSSSMNEANKLLEDENAVLLNKLDEKGEEIAKLKNELNHHRSFKILNDDEYDDDNLLVLDEFKDENSIPENTSKKERTFKCDSSTLSKIPPSSLHSPSNSSGFGGSHSHGFFSPLLMERPSNSRTRNNVASSLSNNLNEVSSNDKTTTLMTVQPRIQRIIKDSNEIGKRLRMISKCFSEISSNIVDGKDPEFFKLASRFDDSSDSGDDINNFENKMSYNSIQFEDVIRKHQENIQKAEKFLSQVSSNIIHYTTRTPGENPMCNIQ